MIGNYIIATACDKSRAKYALNLIASIQARSPGFKEIQVYDLGMTFFQRAQLRGCSGVVLRRVPPFVAHWRKMWTWKTWIWLHAGHRKVIFLDAGTEVLRDLTEVCDLIDRDGYFLVSQFETIEEGLTLKHISPSEYFAEFDVKQSAASRPVVAAGINGFDTASPFYKKVVKSTYQACLKGYNLGWSEHELWRNNGINRQDKPTIRDCEYFRHDQTVLNLMLYKYIPRPIIQPVNKFGGFMGPNDDPEQLIWNSRAHNPLKLIDQLEYRHFSKLRNRVNRIHLRLVDSKPLVLWSRFSNKIQRIIGLS